MPLKALEAVPGQCLASLLPAYLTEGLWGGGKQALLFKWENKCTELHLLHSLLHKVCQRLKGEMRFSETLFTILAILRCHVLDHLSLRSALRNSSTTATLLMPYHPGSFRPSSFQAVARPLIAEMCKGTLLPSPPLIVDISDVGARKAVHCLEKSGRLLPLTLRLGFKRNSVGFGVKW